MRSCCLFWNPVAWAVALLFLPSVASLSISPTKDESGTSESLQIVFSHDIPGSKTFPIFATTANVDEISGPRYSVNGGSTALSNADIVTLSTESFYSSNPCSGANYEKANQRPADCPAMSDGSDFTFTSCLGANQVARGAALSFSAPVRTVWVVAYGCVTKGSSKTVQAGPAIYGPYKLVKVGRITWDNTNIAGATKKGGDTVVVSLQYENPIIITGPIHLFYYKLNPGADANILSEYTLVSQIDVNIAKPSHATSTAESSTSFLLSNTPEQGTYRLLAKASTVQPGSGDVETFSAKFTIAPTITPTVVESYVGNGTYTISWIKKNLGAANLDLLLYYNGLQSRLLVNDYSGAINAHSIVIPADVEGGSGYTIVIDTGTHQGSSESFSIQPKFTIKSVGKTGESFDDHSMHYHGSDKVLVKWFSTNDPTNQNKWNVVFDLCKENSGSCNIVPPLSAAFEEKVYSAGVPASAAVTIPADTVVSPGQYYYVRVRDSDRSEVNVLIPNPITVVGTIVLQLASNSTETTVAGGDILRLSWLTRNLVGDLNFYVCDRAAVEEGDGMYHVSCITLGTKTVAMSAGDFLIPSTSNFLHAENQYCIGVKSVAENLEEFLYSGTASDKVYTWISVAGRLTVSKPVANKIVFGASPLTIQFASANMDGKLNVTLCRSRDQPPRDGTCVSLDNNLGFDRLNKTYTTPASATLFGETGTYYVCISSISYSEVFACSPGFTIEASVVFNMNGEDDIKAGDEITILYEPRNIVGEIILELCTPEKCFELLNNLDGTKEGESPCTITIPDGKDVIYRTDYRLRATPKFRALASSESSTFTVKPKVAMSIESVVETPKAVFRGGVTKGSTIVAGGVDANVSLSLCWNNGATCHSKSPAPFQNFMLIAGNPVEVELNFPTDLVLVREDYRIVVSIFGCSPSTYQCDLLGSSSPAFTIIQNTPPELVSVSLGKATVYPLSAFVSCIPGVVNDPEHSTFSFRYQWQQAPESQVSFSDLVGETSNILSKKWESNTEQHFQRGAKIRCIVVPFDEYDEGEPVASAHIDISPLRVTVNNGEAILTGGTEYSSQALNNDALYCVFPSGNEEEWVEANLGTNNATCTLPNWRYPHGNVPMIAYLGDHPISYTSPEVYFAKKIPNAPLLLGIKGRTEQTSTISIRWTPSKYKDDSWETFESFQLGANRSDETGHSLVLKTILPSWDFSQGPLDSNFAPTTEALHDITGLLGSPAKYRVAVRTLNSVGYSQWSEWSNPIPMQPAQPPSKPAAPIVTLVSSDKIEVLFTEPDDARGSPVKGYEIDVGKVTPGECDGVLWTTATSTTNDLKCVETSMKFSCSGMDKESRYVFRIRAKNDAESNGGLSDSSVASSPSVQLNDNVVDVYIDPENGEDNNCTTGETSTKPCRTLTHAALNTKGSRGQKYFLRPGTYKENGLVFPMAAVSIISTNGPNHTVFDCMGRQCIFTSVELAEPMFPVLIEGIRFQNASLYGALAVGADVATESWARLNSPVEILNCIFDKNIAIPSSIVKEFGGRISSGGALSIFNSHAVAIRNCSFYDNAAKDGGSISILSSTVEISGCIFKRNNASINGGAIYASSMPTYARSTISMSSVTIFRSQAENMGGAVYADSVDINIVSSTFDACSAKSEGGVFYVASSVLIVEDSSFKSNSAGVIQSSSASSGGVVKCLASKLLDFKRTTFSDNVVQASSGGDGGVISTIYCGISMTSCKAISNSATRDGGVLHLTGNSKLSLFQSEFERNEALAHGGTVFCDSCVAGSKTVDNRIINSTALEGGAIALYATKMFGITSSVFEGCTATGPVGGSALYIGAGADPEQVTISLTTVKNCKAAGGGGSILWKPGPQTNFIPPVKIDSATAQRQTSNYALYGPFLASEAYSILLSTVAATKFVNVSSGQPLSEMAFAQVVDYYGSVCVNDDTTTVQLIQSTNGIGFHRHLVTQKTSKNGIVNFEGFGVFGLPGSAGELLLAGSNMINRPLVVKTNTRLCTPGEYTNQISKTCSFCSPGKISITINASTCQKCPAGFYVHTSGAKTCDKCQKGKYGNIDGLSQCELCSPGKYTDLLNATMCEECVAGKHMLGVGAEQCVDCQIGTYSTKGSTNCENCEEGKASQALGATYCTGCKNGNYQDEERQSSCKFCPAGKKGEQENNLPACKKCHPGKFSDTMGSTVCTECVPGHYSNTNGAQNCTKCELGLVAENPGAEYCEKCSSGFFSDPKDPRICQLCPWGLIQPQIGKEACVSCEPGKFSKDLAKPVMCTDCYSGWYTDQYASTICKQTPPGYRAFTNKSRVVPCSPGTFSEGVSTTCNLAEPGFFVGRWNSSKASECSAGRFSSSPGSTICQSCPRGKFQTISKAKSCQSSNLGYATNMTLGAVTQIRCPAGKFSSGEQAQCTVCNAGTSSSSGSAYCTKCDAGFYTNIDGASACEPCPKGSWTEGSNATFCQLCPQGKYGNGFEKCQDCTVGRFAANSGAVSCNLCPVGHTSVAIGSPECEKCDPGKFAEEAGSMMCESCAINSYAGAFGKDSCSKCESKSWTKRQRGANVCVPCVMGEVYPIEGQGDCLRCRPESYSFYPGENIPKACHLCPKGASCKGGGQVDVRVGYWRSHQFANVMNLCTVPEACLGVRRVQDHPFNTFAIATTENVSNLCRIGHGGPICNSCVEGYGKAGRVCQKCGSAVIEQMLAVMRLAIMCVLLTYMVVSTMKNSIKTVRSPRMTILKILLSHIQVLSLNSAYGVDWPPAIVYLLSLFDLVGYIDALFPLDCGLQGSNYFQRSLTYLLIPIFYVPMGVIFFRIQEWLHSKCAAKPKPKPARNNEKVSTTAVFPIKQGLDARRAQSNAASKKKKELMDWAVFNLRTKMEAVVVVSSIILYPSMTKRTLSLFSCQTIYTFLEDTGEDVPFYVLSADTSIQCHTAEHLGWQMFLGVPCVILYVIGVPVFCLSNLFLQRHDICTPKLEDISKRAIGVYGFLFRSYEPDWYWWEVVRISRKTVMISVAIFCRSFGKINHVLVSIVIMAINFALHQNAMPFQSLYLDNLEKYALMCQFFTLYSGLFFINEETTAFVGDFFVVFVITVNVVFSAVCIGSYLLYGKWNKCSRRFRKKKTSRPKTKAKLAHAMKQIHTKSFVSKITGNDSLSVVPLLLHIQCTYCEVDASKRPVRVCGTCKTVYYCSNACQKSHWKKGHSHQCSNQNASKSSTGTPFSAPKKPATKHISPNSQQLKSVPQNNGPKGKSKMVQI